MKVRQPKGRSIFSLAKAIGAEVAHEDGNDVIESRKTLAKIINEVKNGGKGTWFLEFDTYRWREHCGHQYDNHIGYRKEEEFLVWKKRDPIEIFRKKAPDLIDFESIDKLLEVEIKEAFSKAKSDPFPEPAETFKNIYASNE